jgi:DNA-directed RNA polymerase
MTRDEKTASLVNLTPSPLPQDVYTTVADSVTTRIAKDAVTPEGNAYAREALAFGIDRKMVKRNVMTYSYSSKKFGMAQQLQEDLMRPLAFDVLSGKLDEHPFGFDDGRPAAKYLAGHIYDAIEQLVTLPAQAMVLLQKHARVLAHEGKPLTWTTPLGLPWINRYHAPVLKRVGLWLRDTRIRTVVAEGSEKAIDKDKAANGVAPNFVHALDAAHLLMTTNACVSENITQLATVHDSFGCLAPQATRFNQIIREQFVKLYADHDVLAEVTAQASHDLTVHNRNRLPEALQYGTLDLKEVINADFAFA